jgi:hypothetical protein
MIPYGIVLLQFGNPLSSSISGLKAKIEWGKVDTKGVAHNTGSKDMIFAQSLPRGAWTSISIVLDGTPPSELGFVRLSDIQHTGIELIRATPKSR